MHRSTSEQGLRDDSVSLDHEEGRRGVCVRVCLCVCEVWVKSHKCFSSLLRHRKRGSGILCGNILWLKVGFLTDG